MKIYYLKDYKKELFPDFAKALQPFQDPIQAPKLILIKGGK